MKRMICTCFSVSEIAEDSFVNDVHWLLMLFFLLELHSKCFNLFFLRWLEIKQLRTVYDWKQLLVDKFQHFSSFCLLSYHNKVLLEIVFFSTWVCCCHVDLCIRIFLPMFSPTKISASSTLSPKQVITSFVPLHRPSY